MKNRDTVKFIRKKAKKKSSESYFVIEVAVAVSVILWYSNVNRFSMMVYFSESPSHEKRVNEN